MLEKLYGNQSAAHLKLGNWQRAVETADLCLKKNENNYKAMFRKGKALGEQGFWERAEPILKDLLKKNPAGECSVMSAVYPEQDIERKIYVLICLCVNLLQRHRASTLRWHVCWRSTSRSARRRTKS
jgi:tetratricopeptide (TPR) repeat protein